MAGKIKHVHKFDVAFFKTKQHVFNTLTGFILRSTRCTCSRSWLPISPFPILFHQKDSPASTAHAASRCRSLVFSLSPYILTLNFPYIKRDLKSTKCYVSCNPVSWFSSCSTIRPDSLTYSCLIFSTIVALSLFVIKKCIKPGILML